MYRVEWIRRQGCKAKAGREGFTFCINAWKACRVTRGETLVSTGRSAISWNLEKDDKTLNECGKINDSLQRLTVVLSADTTTLTHLRKNQVGWIMANTMPSLSQHYLERLQGILYVKRFKVLGEDIILQCRQGGFTALPLYNKAQYTAVRDTMQSLAASELSMQHICMSHIFAAIGDFML